jgi:hypothetical protein
VGLGDWFKSALTRSTDEVTLALPNEEPATIEDVIARMRLIQAQLPSRDGVAQFNRMYLTVTEEVLTKSSAHAFEDQEFVERLDVVFANLYFKALRDHASDPGTSARCWIPLFEARGSSRIAPIQFALAGMNAHINHDLVLALADTCRELEREPERDTPHYRDFRRINELLAEAQTGSLEKVRENVWVQTEALWLIRAQKPLAERFLLALDRAVGFAGRGLLFERPF